MDKTPEELIGRQRLIFEACSKISKGEQLRSEGMMELANLVPEGKTVANRTLRASPTNWSLRTDDQISAQIMSMIENGEKVTTNYVHEKLGITEPHARKIREKLRNKIDIEKAPKGRAKLWKKKQATPTDPDLSARVLNVIKSNDYVTVHFVTEKLGVSWATANRALQQLRTGGVIKMIKKNHNPAHKGTPVFNRQYDYWTV